MPVLLIWTFVLIQMNGDIAFSGGCMEARGARIWIFVGFVLGFAAIIAAVWSMIASFSSENSQYRTESIHRSFSRQVSFHVTNFGITLFRFTEDSWPAISVLIQNIFIFLGSIVFKFGRTEEAY